MMINEMVLNLGFKPTMLTAASLMEDIESAGYNEYVGWVAEDERLIFYSDGAEDKLRAVLDDLKERKIILDYTFRRVRRSRNKMEIITRASKVSKEIAFHIYALSDLLTLGMQYINSIFGAEEKKIRDKDTLDRIKRIASSDSLIKDELLKQEIVKRTLAMEG